MVHAVNHDSFTTVDTKERRTTWTIWPLGNFDFRMFCVLNRFIFHIFRFSSNSRNQLKSIIRSIFFLS
jgi:hypothetical protein